MALSATSFLLKTTRICYENMPKTTRLATLEEGGSGTAGMLLVAGKERQGKRGCCAPMAALEDVERDDALTRLEHAEANGAVDVDDPRALQHLAAGEHLSTMGSRPGAGAPLQHESGRDASSFDLT